jgi:hypothetical protein
MTVMETLRHFLPFWWVLFQHVMADLNDELLGFGPRIGIGSIGSFAKAKFTPNSYHNFCVFKTTGIPLPCKEPQHAGYM